MTFIRGQRVFYYIMKGTRILQQHAIVDCMSDDGTRVWVKPTGGGGFLRPAHPKKKLIPVQKVKLNRD